MSRIIKACEILDIRLLEVKYNDSDTESYFSSSYTSTPRQGNIATLPTKAIDSSTIRRKTAPKPGPLKTTRLLITGMTCSACVSTLTHTLASHPSVLRTKVSLLLNRATIIFDSRNGSTGDLISVVEDIGYGAQEISESRDSSATQKLHLVRREEELQAFKQAFNGAARWSTIVAILDWSQKLVAGSAPAHFLYPFFHLTSLVVACHVQMNYAVWVHRNAWSSCYRKGQYRLPQLTMDSLLSLSLALSIVLSIFNLAFHGLSNFQTKTYFTTASFLSVVVSGARYLDVALSRQGAASFARLFGLQREMEMQTVWVEGRLGQSLAAGEKVNMGREDNATLCPTTLLAPLDTYHIAPQSLIPCDSYVVRGTSLIDESNMTGESMPSRKSVGEILMSGTRNVSAPLVAVVLKEQTESSLAKLVESTGEATAMKYTDELSGNETGIFGDIMTRYFVPAVLVLAVLSFVITFGLSINASSIGERFNRGCERAMAVLAAACPCAIGLANHSAIMAGVDAAYSKGVLIPGGLATLEKLSCLTHMVLDKTGTLTQGRLQVFDVWFAEPFGSDIQKHLCCSLLSAAERDTAQTHPVARTVFQWCVERLKESSHSRDGAVKTVEPGAAQTRNVSTAVGKGVSAEVQGDDGIWYTVHVGSNRFLSEYKISAGHLTSIPLRVDEGRAQVCFAINGKLAGTLVLQDTIRANAAVVIESLKSLGLKLTMLTGDTKAEAHRVSTQLQIPVLAATSLPHEKRDLITSLQERRALSDGCAGEEESSQEYFKERIWPNGRNANKDIVAMLGDGLNDAPAQAAADVGILFCTSPLSSLSSTSNSSLALEATAADVIIVTPDLAALPKLVVIAKKTMAQARWNTCWAVAYNTLAIALAMGAGEFFGLPSPDASSAGMMMAFSSITVLGMSLLLRRQLQ